MRAPATFPDEPEPEPFFAQPMLTWSSAATVQTWNGSTWSTSYQPAVTVITWRRR